MTGSDIIKDVRPIIGDITGHNSTSTDQNIFPYFNVWQYGSPRSNHRIFTYRNTTA